MVLIISKANGLMVRFWGRLVVVWFGVVLLLEALGGLGLAVQPVRLGVGGGCVVWVVLLLGAFGGLGWLCFGWSGWFCFWGLGWFVVALLWAGRLVVVLSWVFACGADGPPLNYG